MSSSDSHSLTYESIVESFVVHRKPYKCDYNECEKSFTTQSRLNAHKVRRHAIDNHKEVITREPIASGSDGVIAGGQQSTASPMTGAISPDTRSVDNKHDLGSDVEDVILTHEYSAGKAPDGTNSAPIVSGQPLPDTDSVIMQCFNSNNANTSQTPAPGALPHDPTRGASVESTLYQTRDGIELTQVVGQHYTPTVHEMAAHNSPDSHYSATGCLDPTVLHRDLRDKPCDLCGKRFRTDTGVETHKKRFHPNGGPTDCPAPPADTSSTATNGDISGASCRPQHPQSTP
ncbi:unnamed protein product [Medioppia subpectinata]|uniref:C2H2-type domain-containing protein n=1 Tax=Medioppia subpectinata TaxID=1979941 RepID=A0A7R9KZ19_9ACAR|nr:unnamed protein product [Medioppia subpectinata]CAG2112210.1 unnamed protein product [Medioppia subpectinata]